MCARRGLQAHVVSPEGNRVRSVLLRGLTVPSMTDGASPNVPGIRRQACRGPEAEAYSDLGYCRFDGIRCLHRAMGERHARRSSRYCLGPTLRLPDLVRGASSGIRLSAACRRALLCLLQPANLEVIQRVHAKLSSVALAEETV